jgi:hypothetical protein
MSCLFLACVSLFGSTWPTLHTTTAQVVDAIGFCQVENGMTEEQVEALLGKGYFVMITGSVARTTVTSLGYPGGHRVDFVDEKVTRKHYRWVQTYWTH